MKSANKKNRRGGRGGRGGRKGGREGGGVQDFRLETCGAIDEEHRDERAVATQTLDLPLLSRSLLLDFCGHLPLSTFNRVVLRNFAGTKVGEAVGGVPPPFF